MIGSKLIRVGNKKDVYEVIVDRSITYITGESGTGKTYFVDVIRSAMKDENVNYFLESDVSIKVVSSVEGIIYCDVNKDCIYIIDEDVCAELTESKSPESIDAFNRLLGFFRRKKTKPYYPNAYFIFMTRQQLINVSTDIMAIYELVPEVEQCITVRRLRKYFTWDYDVTKIKPELALIEGIGSDYLFFKNTLLGCDVVSAEGKNRLVPLLQYIMSEMDYRSIFLFADGASYGYNMLLHEDFLTTLSESKEIDVRLFFPNSFEWLVLKSGLLRIDDDIVEYPENYFDTKDFSGIEPFFTEKLKELSLDSKNRKYKFGVETDNDTIYYPDNVPYSKGISKSGYNRFVDVVLLNKIGIDSMYSTIREVEGFTDSIPTIKNKKCRNLPLISERGKRLIEVIKKYKELEAERKARALANKKLCISD